MSTKAPTLFEDQRLSLADSLRMTAESLCTYGARHPVWVAAWSGGKDSTTCLTTAVHLVETGEVPKPERLIVLNADTRMELPPLYAATREIEGALATRDWIEVRTVTAQMDHRYFVQMLGRGLPPPATGFRWCTGQIKVSPMEDELRRIHRETGKVLLLIGIRMGESAVRDARIVTSCARNGAECGHGWYQQDLPDALCDKLSPILHWRVCHVWDWLMGFAEGHGFPTTAVAEAYGLGEDGSEQERNARTGCVCCPVASADVALEAVLRTPQWAYLAPLKELRALYEELTRPRNRLRMPGGERNADGSLVANQCRKGPLTMEARRMGLSRVLGIQERCNAEARTHGRPLVDLLNPEEVLRIQELTAANTWPQRWTGDEPVADLPYEAVYADGTRQMLLEGMELAG
jgi:DNA sulfur modification protein DndC